MKATADKVWFNTMALIDDDKGNFPNISIILEPDEVLPEGTHSVEVTLKGPDGKERNASATLEVFYAD
ncbi:MAG: hypothetical protein V4436_02505 [Patescibacteria group bacterium]